jgi:hypothetical protein
VDSTSTLNAGAIAQETGVPYWRIVADLVSGRLKGKRVGREWIVRRADLDCWTARCKAEAIPAVEHFAAVRALAERMREWWMGQMRSAQVEAAGAARDFADRYDALKRDAARGRGDPKLAERFGEQMTTLQVALRRMQELDEMFGTVVTPLEAEALAAASEATRVTVGGAVARLPEKAVRGSARQMV